MSEPVVTTTMFTAAERAAWEVAITRGLPIEAADLRAMLAAASRADGVPGGGDPGGGEGEEGDVRARQHGTTLDGRGMTETESLVPPLLVTFDDLRVCVQAAEPGEVIIGRGRDCDGPAAADQL